METRRLEYFVVLASEGNYGRAAERLFITQPALSQQIKKLEDTLGVQLVDRLSRNFSLTTAGARVLEQAYRVLNEASHLKELVSATPMSSTGRLRLGIVSGLFWGDITASIRNFARGNPQIEMELLKGRTAALHEQMSANQLDGVISYSPPTENEAQSITLSRDNYAAVMPENHELARREEVSLGELRDDTFLIIPRYVSPADYDAVISACTQAEFSPRISTQGTAELSVQQNHFAQIGAVASGMGVAIMPMKLSVFQEAFGGVRFVPLDSSAPEVRVRIGWKSAVQSRELQQFLAHMTTAFDNE